MFHAISTWFHTEYLPAHGPFYLGQIWGNVFVVPVAFALGFIWAKTKFWPLRPIEHGVKHLHAKVDSLHDKHDAHTVQLNALQQSLSDLHDKHDALQRHLTAKPS